MDLVARGLRDFYQACIAPHWRGVAAAFRADLTARTPLLAAGGPAALLSSLHPQLTWTGDGLHRVTGTQTFELDGTGMQLVPSVFWTGVPLLSLRAPRYGGNALLYSARPALPGGSPSDGAGDGTDPASGGGTLDRLLGRTRAAALRALQQPCSTTELAGRLRVRPSSASEQARALRDAGLVHTTRHGKAVRHSLTPLGHSLLIQG
jgi:DNA-binding transcriptional ArsR family regulator